MTGVSQLEGLYLLLFYVSFTCTSSDLKYRLKLIAKLLIDPDCYALNLYNLNVDVVPDENIG
jgi:hypothetical protein